MGGFFIGFIDLEEMLEDHDRTKPVMVNLLGCQSKAEHDIGFLEHVIVVQSERPNGIYYVRMVVGRELIFSGHQDGDESDSLKAAREAYSIVVEWLRERGYRTITATVAHPRDIILINGWADFLVWKQETKSYYRRHSLDEKNAALAEQNMRLAAEVLRREAIAS